MKQERIIAVTGTPGSGKSTVARMLAEKIGAELVGVNEFIRERKLATRYEKDGTAVVGINLLEREINKELLKRKGIVVIEGHLLCELKIRNSCIIIVREHLPTIISRLKKRGYSISKIRDNIVSEATDYCGINASLNYERSIELMNDERFLGTAIRFTQNKLKPRNRIDLLIELEKVISKDPRLAL